MSKKLLGKRLSNFMLRIRGILIKNLLLYFFILYTGIGFLMVLLLNTLAFIVPVNEAFYLSLIIILASITLYFFYNMSKLSSGKVVIIDNKDVTSSLLNKQNKGTHDAHHTNIFCMMEQFSCKDKIPILVQYKYIMILFLIILSFSLACNSKEPVKAKVRDVCSSCTADNAYGSAEEENAAAPSFNNKSASKQLLNMDMSIDNLTSDIHNSSSDFDSILDLLALLNDSMRNDGLVLSDDLFSKEFTHVESGLESLLTKLNTGLSLDVLKEMSAKMMFNDMTEAYLMLEDHIQEMDIQETKALHILEQLLQLNKRMTEPTDTGDPVQAGIWTIDETIRDERLHQNVLDHVKESQLWKKLKVSELEPYTAKGLSLCGLTNAYMNIIKSTI